MLMKPCTDCKPVSMLRLNLTNAALSFLDDLPAKQFKQVVNTLFNLLKNPTPQVALRAIRDHWGVENTLHWTLDMSFNEDYSRIRKENAPQVMAMIRHMALNILQQGKLQQKKFKRQSIKGLRKICSWDDDTLSELVSKHRCQPESS